MKVQTCDAQVQRRARLFTLIVVVSYVEKFCIEGIHSLDDDDDDDDDGILMLDAHLRRSLGQISIYDS